MHAHLRSEAYPQELILFYHVDSRDQTQLIRFGGLYAMSHHTIPTRKVLMGVLLNLSLSEALFSMVLFIVFPWPTMVNMNCEHSNQRDEFQRIKSIHHSKALGSSSSLPIMDVLNQTSILGNFVGCFSADLRLQRHSSVGAGVLSVHVGYAGSRLHFPTLFCISLCNNTHSLPKLGVCC